MDSLDDLYVYAVVVETLGFSAAARRLGVSTSAVSRTVRRLETRLGGELLSRSTRALALTDFGREVYEQCARIGEIARELDAIADGHRSAPQGMLRVSAPVSFGQSWLAPRLPGFCARWPDVIVDLTLTDAIVDLMSSRCDLALRISRRIADGLVARTLLEFQFVLVATAAYLERAGTPRHPAELQSHSMLVLGQAGYGHQLALRRGPDEVTLQCRGGLRANNSAVLLQAALLGQGIALVPGWLAASALSEGRLVRLLDDWRLGPPYEDSRVHIVYLPTRHVPPKVRAFVDYLAGPVSPAAARPTARQPRAPRR